MTFEIWLAFAAVAAVNILTPGPAILLAVNVGAHRGQRPVTLFALGNALGLALMGLTAAMGLAELLQRSALVMELLRWVGAGYLVWLGVRFWTMPALLPGQEADGVGPAAGVFRMAFLNAMSNPKQLLFFAAVLPSFVQAADPMLPQMSLLVATYIAMSLASLSAYGGLAARAGRLVRQPSVMRLFHRVSGGILVAVGLTMAVSRR